MDGASTNNMNIDLPEHDREATRLALLEKFNAATTPEAADQIVNDLLTTSSSLPPHSLNIMLNQVALKGTEAAATLLLQKGAEIDAGVIYNAIMNPRGSTSVLEALITSGWDVNKPLKYEGDALVIAVTHNKPDAVRVLLKSGARPTENEGSNGRTTLGDAAVRGSPEIISMLIEHGVKVEKSRALELAARNNRKENVVCLLEKGADVNEVPDKDWWYVSNEDIEAGLGSALHAAASEGHAEIVSLLLENGANPQLEDSMGRTALRRAAFGLHPYAVTALLSKASVAGN